MNRKDIALRALIGGLAGISIGQIVTLIIARGIGDGRFVPAMPQLIARCGSEWNAVFLQTVLTAWIGIIFAEAAILFLYERWSFLKQCVVHFMITAVFYVPFTLFCWMPVSLCNALLMLGTLFFTYALNWLIQYRISCMDVQAINRAIRQKQLDENKEE